MKISELIGKEFVFLDLKAASKEEAIHQMAQRAKGHPQLNDFPSFCRAVYDRESSGSTSIGFGVAIPHARTDQVKDMLLVVGRLAEGIQFNPGDEMPVRMIFLIGTPKRMVAEYLRLIGTLARQLKNDRLREKLLSVADADAFIQAFAETENAPP